MWCLCSMVYIWRSDDITLYVSPHLSSCLRQGFLFTIVCARLGGSWVSRNSVSISFSLKSHWGNAFHGSWGSRLRYSCLDCKPLTNWIIFSALMFIFKDLIFFFVCVSVCVCVHVYAFVHVPTETRKRCKISRNCSCRTLVWFWELNSRPLEQRVLLNTESSL